jgi:hypothetical protein
LVFFLIAQGYENDYGHHKITIIGTGPIVTRNLDLSSFNTGVGSFKAYEMKVNTCNITLTGAGDCKVFVIDELNVTIAGVGYVYYKENPAIN